MGYEILGTERVQARDLRVGDVLVRGDAEDGFAEWPVEAVFRASAGGFHLDLDRWSFYAPNTAFVLVGSGVLTLELRDDQPVLIKARAATDVESVAKGG